MKIEKILKDLQYSATKMSKLHKQMDNDFEFVQGNQWESKDVETLRKAGVKALTINKLKPIIKLLTGLERQSRSDYKVYPEGGEDVITADISSRLIKNVVKNSAAENKLSEVFKHGSIGGMSFLEPYIDYSFDLINGDMKFKKVSGSNIYLDPDFQEYDLSDCKFIFKIKADLSKEDLEFLFPDQLNKIKKIGDGKVNIEGVQAFSESIQTLDYPRLSEGSKYSDKKEDTYDLVEYYYKELKDRYYAVSAERGIMKEFDTKEEAEEFAAQINGDIMKRKVPVIMLAQIVGDQKFYDDVCWTYPRWKTYPLIPYFAEFITENLKDYSLKIQGVVRGIKDLQEEYNKRRTQELRHLNASANSGFDIEKGQLDDENLALLKKHGASPGVVVERKKGTGPLTRISPMPLSQGHAQLAAENAQDLKEASGVNPDLLANDSQSQSGRAILFKQRQGLVMIQEMLDNFSTTKKQVGRFILSQFKELFTVESAMKVLGDAYITDNFTTPVSIVLERALQKVQNNEQPTQLEQSVLLQYPNQYSDQPIVDENNNLESMVDLDTAMITINTILNDASINKYDVAIGEGPYQDTVRMANFMDLKDLAGQGVPIPPNILIETSMLPPNEKNKILKQLEQQALAAQQQAQQQAQQEQQGGTA